jgi:hypothetical protein
MGAAMSENPGQLSGLLQQWNQVDQDALGEVAPALLRESGCVAK